MAEDRMLNDEILLGLIKANAGGGGGGTTNYNQLSNKPQINSVELSGNKSLSDLGIASAQSVSNITNGESINNFAGVENALNGKQDALTAGDYIDITNGEISVNREIPANNFTYELVTKSIGNSDASMTVKKYANGSLVSSTDYLYNNVTTPVNIDNYLTLQYASGGWKYTLLQASTDHASGYVATWGYQTVVDYTEVFPTEDTSGLKLIIKSELDTALESKQDALTFDDTPTDGSNNPVKSNGIYDALATKADTDMVAADFNAGSSYTAGNYCVQDGKLYKFKNNHSGAWSSADVDEVKITGELSALKNGLTDALGNVKFAVLDIPNDKSTATLTTTISAQNVVFISSFPCGANDGYEDVTVDLNGGVVIITKPSATYGGVNQHFYLLYAYV